MLSRRFIFSRPFSALSPSLWHPKPLPPRAVIPETDITESFLKGTGPGGQKINKTSSAVQLKHLPTGIVVKCQATRSREQNRRTARKLLGERLEELELGEGARTRVKAEAARAKKSSADKKKKRKYRKLEEEKAGKAGSGDEEHQDGIEDAQVDEAIDSVTEKAEQHHKQQQVPP